MAKTLYTLFLTSKKCTKPSQGHASPFLLDKGLDSIEAAGERVTIQFILFRDPYI